MSDKLNSSRPSLNNLTGPPQTCSDDTPMTVVVEQEVERSSLSVSGCIESCDKNAEVAVTSTYLKSSLNTQPSGQSLMLPFLRKLSRRKKKKLHRAGLCFPFHAEDSL